MRVVMITENDRRESHNLPTDLSVWSWINHFGNNPIDFKVYPGYVDGIDFCCIPNPRNGITPYTFKSIPIRFEIYEHSGRPMSRVRIEYILSLPVRKLSNKLPCPACTGELDKCMDCGGTGEVNPDPTMLGDIIFRGGPEVG